MMRMSVPAFGAALLGALVVLSAVGCGGSGGDSDAGVDSGSVFHGGNGDAGQDGGPTEDAGADAGGGQDAGGDGGEMIPDGGETTDAGEMMDGGESTDGGAFNLPSPHEAEGLVDHTNDDSSSAELLQPIPNSTSQHLYGIIGDDTDVDVYGFTAAPGQILRVTVSALPGADFQAFARIDDENFLYLRDVPLDPATPATATREFVITAPGNYFISVEDARNADGLTAGGPTAGYEVTIDVVTPAPTALTLPASGQAGTIAANGAVSVYAFSGTTAQALQAAVNASQLPTPTDVDPILVLLDPQGQVVKFNEDLDPFGGNTDSAITAELPSVGTYQLIVDYTDLAGPNRGFTIDASTFTPPPGDTCSTALALLPAATLNGNTSSFHDFYDPGANPSAACSSDLFFNYPGQDVVYSIPVGAGQTLSVTITPDPSFDPSLVISTACPDLGGTCVGAMDSGANGDPETATFTNGTGSPVTVFVEVDSYDAAAPGAYGIQATLQ